jgi:nanoRNase/pAp phosphatase (c-di-AMP/oligoRNAs hydrolase)
LRYIILCDDEFPFYLTRKDHREEIVFVCASVQLQKRLNRWGVKCRTGNLLGGRVFQRLKICSTDRIAIFLRDPQNRVGVLNSVMEHTDVFAITFVEEQKDKRQTLAVTHPRVRTVAIGDICRNGLIKELEKTISAARIRTLQSIFHDQEKVLLLLQYDPDPDAIASALAMRILLGRNKLSAPIATFGGVSRPENQAMLKIMEIELNQIRPEELADFNRIVLLDVQPSHFKQRQFPVHVIIDHHPENESADCLYKDIRPHYGATSTILTEYLQAGGIKITQKLATALLYGIKTDTLLLEREAVESDLTAFSDLYPMANHRMIRRMERPQLPRGDLSVLSKAFKNAVIMDDVLFVHLDDLTREDIVPYIADFCLEVEGVEWAVVSGVFQEKLIVSSRNYGTTKSAGEIMRAAFLEFGLAGGHRSMAKAVIAMEALAAKNIKELGPFVRKSFLENYRNP